jgi:hypothetical protein
VPTSLEKKLKKECPGNRGACTIPSEKAKVDAAVDRKFPEPVRKRRKSPILKDSRKRSIAYR